VSAPHAVAELLRRRAAGGSHDGDGARLALAIEGGGMRGAVSAGMAIALDELGLTDAFDAVYGASAGALNGVWLLSGNPSDGLRPYADPALIRQYIRRSNALRGRPVVDTVHLVEHLYEHVLPLRFDAVLSHRVRFHPLATDVETGRAVDLGPTVRDRASLKLALRATTALPLLAGPPVVIDGRRYLDAGLAESIPFHAALAAGATHVLVLRSRRPQDDERPSPLSRAVTGTLLRRLGEPVRRGYLERPDRLAADDALLEDHEAVLAIRPPADSPRVSRLESDSGVVRAGLEAGRDVALAVLRPLLA
jgi:predicted patatin/cPLA2 family phospholipase